MKILIVTTVYYPDVIGGGEFSLKFIAEGLANRGHDITIECLGMEEKREELNCVHINRHYIKGVSELELSHTRNHKEIENCLSQYKKLSYRLSDVFFNKKQYNYYLRIICDGRYDAVQSATAINYMGRFNFWKAAYDLKIPVSHVARSPQLLKIDIAGNVFNSLYKHRIAKTAQYLTAFTAPSQYMIDRHKQIGIKIPVMYPIYNALEFSMTDITWEHISSKKNIILYAGDLRKEKGIFTLYKAFLSLSTDAELIYVGSGVEFETLSTHKNIKVINWMAKEELYNLMKRAKLLVLPSEWEEAFGRTLIESVFNGTLSIGSDSGGIPEVLDNDNKYIFQSGDYNELTDKIERILGLTNENYMEEIKRQQERMKKFTSDIFLDKWERFFLNQIRKQE